MAGLTQKVAAAEQAQLRCRELENALRDLRAQLKEAQEEASTLKVGGGGGGVPRCRWHRRLAGWQAGWLPGRQGALGPRKGLLASLSA